MLQVTHLPPVFFFTDGRAGTPGTVKERAVSSHGFVLQDHDPEPKS